MVKYKVLYSFTTWKIFLHLGDEKVMGASCDITTLFVVEIVIIGIHFKIIVCCLGSPVNAQLHIVVIEGYEWQCTLWPFTKEKAKWIKIGSRMNPWVCTDSAPRYILSKCINRNLFRKDRVLCIYHRTTNEQLNLINEKIPSLCVKSLIGVINC